MGMKRRTLLQGIGVSTAMAVGAATTAGAAEKTVDAGGPTHVSVKDDDGNRRLVRLGVLEDGIRSLDVDPADTCTAACCYECSCRRCLCQLCCGDPESSC